jgi:hypothetical protein
MSDNPYQPPAQPAPRPKLPRPRKAVFHVFRAIGSLKDLTPVERAMFYGVASMPAVGPFSLIFLLHADVVPPLSPEQADGLLLGASSSWVVLFYGLGCLVWRRRVLKPLRELTVRIAYNPQEPANYFERGEMYLVSTLERQRAADDFSRVIELEPDNWLAYSRRGEALLRDKQFEAAAVDLTRAIALAAETDQLSAAEGWLYAVRARAHEGSGDYDRAVEDFSEAFRLAQQCEEMTNRELARLLYARAVAHRQAGNRAEARTDFAEAHRYDRWWQLDPRAGRDAFWPLMLFVFLPLILGLAVWWIL